MLFTNYLQKEKRESEASCGLSIPPLDLNNAGSRKGEGSKLSTHEPASVSSRKLKVMRLKEVESEYDESALGGDTSRKMTQCTPKYVSKLERYIAQPYKAIESMILKDPKLDTQHRTPTG